MSQAVAYTPPDYVPPELVKDDFEGHERRSKDPVNQLGRSLNRLCLEATDPYEIVAHLEALGLNSATALARFGVTSHFELAHELYERTPRIRLRRSTKLRRTRDWGTPVAMGAAFVVTFLLGAFSQVEMLAPALAILVWSQVGSALLSKADGELLESDRRVVLAAVVQSGILAIALSWCILRFGLPTLTPTLTWFAVGSLLWAHRYLAAVAVPVLIGAALALTELASFPEPTPQVTALLVTAFFCGPLIAKDPRTSFSWLRRSAGAVPHPLLYGIGQGMLIVALMKDNDPSRNVLPGAVLLLVILLVSQRLLVILERALTHGLWRARSPVRFQVFAHLVLLAYVALFLLPLLIAGGLEFLWGPAPWHFHWYAFGLLGVSLGISVVKFALGNPAGASVPFLIAGLAAASGAPFLWVTLGLATALLLVAQVRVGQVGRYAIYLL